MQQQCFTIETTISRESRPEVMSQPQQSTHEDRGRHAVLSKAGRRIQGIWATSAVKRHPEAEPHDQVSNSCKGCSYLFDFKQEEEMQTSTILPPTQGNPGLE